MWTSLPSCWTCVYAAGLLELQLVGAVAARVAVVVVVVVVVALAVLGEH